MSDGYRDARSLRQLVLGYWIWRYERRAVTRVRHTFVSFVGDIARFPAKKVSALANGFTSPTRTEPSRNGRHGRGAAPRLGFVGLLSHEPNRLALMTFAREVLPSMRSEPDLAAIELWVAGGQLRAHDAAQLRATPGVVVWGYVPEIAAFYAGIDLAIAPMDQGAGTPTKVIEALGHGVPVIGTELALRGLDDDLRQWCVEVSGSAWTSAVQAGLRMLRAHAPPMDEVYRRYSWSAVFDRVVAPVREGANG